MKMIRTCFQKSYSYDCEQYLLYMPSQCGDGWRLLILLKNRMTVTSHYEPKQAPAVTTMSLMTKHI